MWLIKEHVITINMWIVNLDTRIPHSLIKYDYRIKTRKDEIYLTDICSSSTSFLSSNLYNTAWSKHEEKCIILIHHTSHRLQSNWNTQVNTNRGKLYETDDHTSGKKFKASQNLRWTSQSSFELYDSRFSRMNHEDEWQGTDVRCELTCQLSVDVQLKHDQLEVLTQPQQLRTTNY